jgi:hypothetical protein
MYKSPIEMLTQGFNLQVENGVYKAVESYGINVDKDELIKALQYDRNQYNKGYADGYSEFAFDFYKAFREHYKAYIPDGLVRMADVVELLESVKQGGVAE